MKHLRTEKERIHEAFLIISAGSWLHRVLLKGRTV